MTDQELIQGCLKNNRQSQKLLYEKYCGQMYGICLRYCKNEDSASEALQNGFIRVFRNLKKFRGESEIGAWIRKIIVRASIDQLNLNKAEFKYNIFEIDENEFSYQMSMNFDDVGLNHLLDILNLLPEGYKLVFSMNVLDEMKHSEIAEILGISEVTSRSQLFKAKKMLRNIITDSSNFTYKYQI